LPILHAANAILFVVTGDGKMEKMVQVQECVKQKSMADRLAVPASMAVTSSGETIWFLDAPAASLMKDVAAL
jgi:6-phosphogluconolactonase/glucosamine-6-phosphate isomerase/deaminase